MKIVVIGGSGLIGGKVVKTLTALGHDAVAASPRSGVDTTTGEGVKAALAKADVVVDVSNSPSFADEAVLTFFEASAKNLTRAAHDAGVRHIIALSVVGTDRVASSGYFRAKLAQERLIEAAGLPCSIIRATQFFEFMGAIAAGSASGNTIRLPDAAFQPIAADDVAAIVAEAALARPSNGTSDIAGPARYRFATAIAKYLTANKDARTAVADSEATYFGAALDEYSLVPQGTARLGPTSLETWLEQNRGK